MRGVGRQRMLAAIEQKFDGAAALEKETKPLRERNLEIVRAAKLVFPPRSKPK
jgi:hypothetical protein